MDQSNASVRSRKKTWAALAGALCGVVCVAATALTFLPERLPELTREEFDRSMALWDAVSPENYDIEVQVEGRQPAIYRVEVRSGHVRTATRNGNPLRQRRTMGTWSVPGMYGTIERDLVAVERVESGKADRYTPRLLLRAKFDDKWGKLGIPTHYHRIQWGSHTEVRWEVTHFEINPAT